MEVMYLQSSLSAQSAQLSLLMSLHSIGGVVVFTRGVVVSGAGVVVSGAGVVVSAAGVVVLGSSSVPEACTTHLGGRHAEV